MMDKQMPKYVIDTCSLTELRRRYPPDIFPGAWEAVSFMADCGILVSSSEVRLELEAQEDVITEWARGHSHAFLPLYIEIQKKATEILDSYTNLLDIKNQKSSADPFVIATAIIKNCTVVTNEQPNVIGSKLLKIPNVCNFYGVPCISLIDMFRAEGIKLDMSHK